VALVKARRCGWVEPAGPTRTKAAGAIFRAVEDGRYARSHQLVLLPERLGLSRLRYDSPSMTRSKALEVKRSMALWARTGSAKVASHSSGPRFNAEHIVMRS
jgi:hypothetical protein